MNKFNVLIDFLKKYYFILKAAADGWRINYIGGNQYKFLKNIDCITKTQSEVLTTSGFVDNYKLK